MKPGNSFATCLLLISAIAQAQTQPTYQWKNPANEKTALVGGQAWPQAAAHYYDRLPARAEKTVRKEVWDLSRNTAGEYIAFKTSASDIVVRYSSSGSHAFDHMPATGVSGVDLYAIDTDGQWRWAHGKREFGDTIQYHFEHLQLSANEEEFRLYLPLYSTVNWLEIGVPAGAGFQFLPPVREQPIVMYGTSILQGGCASRPGLAFTNILDRQLEHPLINLGFSGNGQLEPAVIDLMNELDARLFVIDCMPNLTDSMQYTRAEIKQRLFNAAEKLQRNHPNTPILFTEHCCGIAAANMDSTLGKNYRYTNSVLNEAFSTMVQAGIKNIYLLTADDIGFNTESTVDGTHPNDIGMMQYANAYENIIRKILHEEKGNTSTTTPVRQRRDYQVYDFMDRHEAVIKTIQEKNPDLLLIGNSIMHFWGGTPYTANRQNGAQAWKKYLEPLHTVNLGFGWDRIENVLWRVYHGELDHGKPTNIVLSIGTNNLGFNNDEEIITGLKHLLQAIRERQPAARIWLSGIYPRRNMEERILTLNKKISVLSNQPNMQFIDPGTALLQANQKIDESFFTDGLHPNEKGYEKLAQALLLHLR